MPKCDPGSPRVRGRRQGAKPRISAAPPWGEPGVFKTSARLCQILQILGSRTLPPAAGPAPWANLGHILASFSLLGPLQKRTHKTHAKETKKNNKHAPQMTPTLHTKSVKNYTFTKKGDMQSDW
jgi:hypothetical protein